MTLPTQQAQTDEIQVLLGTNEREFLWLPTEDGLGVRPMTLQDVHSREEAAYEEAYYDQPSATSIFNKGRIATLEAVISEVEGMKIKPGDTSNRDIVSYSSYNQSLLDLLTSLKEARKEIELLQALKK